MTETTPLAPSAAAAAERLAVWVIGALTVIVIGGVALLIYFGLLVPHIVLAALVVPLALTTIHCAWRGRFDRHRRLARVTLPIWLYVSVSGVLVYVLLYHSGR